MKKQGLLFTLIAAATLGIGCSDVGFKSIPSPTCVNFNNGSDQSCVVQPQGNVYTVEFKTGLIDILFINDNSGSMSPEQAKMADAFPKFFDNIRHLDYQIAMTTTDTANNKGNLLEFKTTSGAASGKYILKKGAESEAQQIDLFRGTVERNETIVCEQSGYQNCPSSDERGIYAMNLVVQNNQHSFLRAGAHLAIVVLSDEDQRGWTEWIPQEGEYLSGYNWKWNSTTNQYEFVNGWPHLNLQDVDYPEALLTTFSAKYASKSLSVHSVIVKPGDQTCWNQQYVAPGARGNPSALIGRYGYLYNVLSTQSSQLSQYGSIGQGTVTSICNSTYDQNLTSMAFRAAANANTQKVKMLCLPESGDITVTSSQTVNYTIDASEQAVVFTNLPYGVEVTVSYECPNSV